MRKRGWTNQELIIAITNERDIACNATYMDSHARTFHDGMAYAYAQILFSKSVRFKSVTEITDLIDTGKLK